MVQLKGSIDRLTNLLGKNSDEFFVVVLGIATIGFHFYNFPAIKFKWISIGLNFVLVCVKCIE